MLTPTLALMAVGRKLMNAKRATPAGVVKVAQPSDQRLINSAPTIASSVLPIPIDAAVTSVPAVVALAMNAPAKIAGQMRGPRSNTAASAKPAGGQIGVALGLIEASNRPLFASAK